MLEAVQGELLKIRKRWMPYVLFLILLAGAAFMVWFGGYGSWKNSDGPDLLSSFRTFALPYSIPALLDTGQWWGSLVFVAILTSSTVATEYGWGTVRQALIRGQSRDAFLLVTLAGLVIACAVGLLLAFAVALSFSILATSLADLDITLDVPGAPSGLGYLMMFVRTALCILPYGLLAFTLAVIGRSTALGVGGTMGYMFGESIVIAIFGGMSEPFRDARAYFIGHNVTGLLAENRIGPGDYNSVAPREIEDPSALPDPWLAALVIGLYCAAFLFIAFSVFRRRDVTVSTAT